MPRKSKSSKSSKKRKSSKTSNPSSSKDVNVSEINVIAKQCPDEEAGASIQTKSGDLKTPADESKSKIYVYYDSSFELNNIPSDFKIHSPNASASCFEKSKSDEILARSKWIESPMRSESVIPIMRPEFNESLSTSESAILPQRSASAGPLLRSKSVEPLLRKIISEPILKSELTDWAIELLHTQLTRKRRPHFQHLFEIATNIVDYMEYLGTFRKSENGKKHLANNRWKQNDSSDWFELLNLWDTTQCDIRAFMEALQDTYGNFEPDANISMTVYEFASFLEDITVIFESIGLLLKRCTNCCNKYSRFCATSNESIFLKNASNFRRNINYFYKKITVELCKFEVLNNLTLYG